MHYASTVGTVKRLCLRVHPRLRGPTEYALTPSRACILSRARSRMYRVQGPSTKTRTMRAGVHCI